MTTRRIDVVLFDGFELLDVFGPVQLWSVLGDAVDVALVGPARGPVRSSQGTRVEVTTAYADAPPPDVVLVPGGAGTRALVHDAGFLAWLARWSADASLVTSVCTGSAVLAAAGLLDGYRATSNKYAFGWASTHGDDVAWVPQARWVEDRDRWTSSGVAAGMDMTVALIRHLFGPQAAEAAATFTELDVHRDPGWDPFASRHGLV
ncbi:DJ-1/PfpI family protein [Xylanimonas allomyrinae]|uniref:DJ-1/PfpI family protein n=1 Tax=Xylanimonas allomyrinae TaxID=2509459 RepID=A0A4P6EKP2_9MICO|nr:DJ-1/PfpI family protein [Xylanimonas allomyrinae]QAY62716.1 DJ-1/PfpI family protein [Xylanimonas allomyrinae]